MSAAPGNLRQLLSPLRPFATRYSKVNYIEGQMYSCFLSASFIRAFEFAELSSRQEPESAFFVAPALRGITEDIIYLEFLSGIGPDTREQFLLNMVQLEAHKLANVQIQFFRRFRPSQLVLGPPKSDEREIRKKLKEFWKKNGWQDSGRVPPSTEAIAKQSGTFQLSILYDFVYRFTSTMVHFNTEVLLRNGWLQGSGNFKFSTSNMGKYYLSVCQIYGCFLLCIYFEFFGEFFRLSQSEEIAVQKLRSYLLGVPRWPEPLTFEEMNHSRPNINPVPAALRKMVIDSFMKDGFISGSEEVQSILDSSASRSQP